MSMVTYIGLNSTVQRCEYVTDNEVDIDYVFSEAENRNTIREKHFSTPYVYEIAEKGEPIWQLTEYHKVHSPHNYQKSKKTFQYLCDLLMDLLSPGDYCELYVCYLGEENEEQENDCTVHLDNLDIDLLHIDEKMLIRIER
ncbi:hypothetical protein [Priestia koreensis]|uniref:hypothetical protein n=1 Tax=Priestia koreensis TaxID=284581 RepID=UPI001F585F39|nr:hypothetical protein [Priestia koreensis]UNL86941.1 hypothetical protein IE339_10820 [Priestia koreensis]